METCRRGPKWYRVWRQRSLMMLRGVLVLLVNLLGGCAQSTPAPITTWMTIPDYPNMATVIDRERGDTEEIVIFTTTDPITTVVTWYDTTYGPPAWANTHGPPDAYSHIRSYAQETSKCYYFTVSIAFDPLQQTYTQTLSRFAERRCSGP